MNISFTQDEIPDITSAGPVHIPPGFTNTNQKIMNVDIQKLDLYDFRA